MMRSALRTFLLIVLALGAAIVIALNAFVDGWREFTVALLAAGLVWWADSLWRWMKMRIEDRNMPYLSY